MLGEGIFLSPVPIPWAIGDIIVYILLAVTAVYLIKRSSHPEVLLMEGIAFCFLYAGMYENGAGVSGFYNFGRSILTFGSVPFSIPAIEVLVLLTGLWMLDKMHLPKWLQPIVLALFGLVQDLTLDPLSVKQIFTVNGITSSRWNWVITGKSVTMFDVPVYNFPGWCIIMLYSSALLLIGRYIFKKLHYNKAFGYAYPFVLMPIATLMMRSFISQFLLWGGSLGGMKTNAEWIVFVIWIAVPVLVLAFVWKGKMKEGISLKKDLPIFLVPILLHLTDIVFTIYGQYWELLPFNLIITIVHIGFLAFVFCQSKKAPINDEVYSLRI